jgi:hypothetical protein
MRRALVTGLLVIAAGLVALTDAVAVGAVSDRDLISAQSSQLRAMQAEQGTTTALAELERRSRQDSRISAICHAVAHDLGHAALDRAGGRLAAALAVRSDVCGGGYVHGVVERMLATSPRPARELARVCGADDGSCWHGVGHGFMFATRMDPDRSLRLCASAPNPLMERRCGEGVFMQLFNAESLSADFVPSAAEARATCLATAAPQTANCWFYAPNVLLASKPDAFSAAMRWCASLPSEVGRQVCARGVGSRTVKRHADNLSIGVRTCAKAGALQRSCLGGMASYWSVHWQGDRKPESLCAELPSLRRECQQAVRG